MDEEDESFDTSSLVGGVSLLDDARRFRTTMIDVPWPEHGGGRVKRGADRHYSLLDKPGCKKVPDALRVIQSCPIWNPHEDAAHLWLWVTDNYLEAGLWLISQLQFEYKRMFPWVKTQGSVELDDLDQEDLRSGIGQYALGQHEVMLFATRGKGMSELVYQPTRKVKSVIVAPHEKAVNGKRIHSRKPLASYERIEARSKGPYAEIFGRIRRDNWSVWGDEMKPSGDVDGS